MSKFFKVGKVLLKKDKTGRYISLGDPNGKKYAYTVDIRIKNAADETVFQGTNCAVFMQDPRKRPGITEEQSEKIPSFILEELFVVEKDDE